MPDIAGPYILEDGDARANGMAFQIVRPGVDVRVTLQIYREGELMVLGLRRLEGKVTLRPRERLRVFREELDKIEALARSAGIQEIRHCGGRMGHFFNDYEPLPALRNGVRKRL